MCDRSGISFCPLLTVSRVGLSLQCSLCTKCFFSRTELHLHEASKHRGEKLFVCEECGHRASSRNGLQMHIKAIHRWDLQCHFTVHHHPYTCAVCTVYNACICHTRCWKLCIFFCPWMSLFRNERPFVCEFCNHAFTQKANLNMHLRTHTGEKPFQCHLCGKTFRTQGRLHGATTVFLSSFLQESKNIYILF